VETSTWVQELFRAIDSRDAAGFAAFLTEDVLFRYGSQAPMSGRDRVQAHVADFFSSLVGLRHEVLGTWWDEPSHTCVVQGEVAYSLKDGRRVNLPFVNLMELREERIQRYLIYADPTPLICTSDGSQRQRA
jgi:ketosteroid isomerase-like protein